MDYKSVDLGSVHCGKIKMAPLSAPPTCGQNGRHSHFRPRVHVCVTVSVCVCT